MNVTACALSPRLRNFVAIDADAPVTTDQLAAIFGGDRLRCGTSCGCVCEAVTL